MNRDDIEPRIAEILSLVLDRSVEPSDRFDRESEPKWDSLKHVEILFATEAAFEITFSEDDAGEIMSVDDLIAAVERYRAA